MMQFYVCISPLPPLPFQPVSHLGNPDFGTDVIGIKTKATCCIHFSALSRRAIL